MTQDSVGEAPQPERPQQRGRRGLWIVLGVLVVAAVVGVVFGGALALRGRGLGSPAGSTPDARPTFVVATLPSPSPSASARPSALPAAAADEYIVEPGDTLRSIAERVYGDATQWSRIYDANRSAIGPNPDTITAGTRLRIPRP